VKTAAPPPRPRTAIALAAAVAAAAAGAAGACRSDLRIGTGAGDAGAPDATGEHPPGSSGGARGSGGSGASGSGGAAPIPGSGGGRGPGGATDGAAGRGGAGGASAFVLSFLAAPDYVAVSPPWGSAYQLVLADIDGNRTLDLVVLFSAPGSPENGGVAVVPNRGDGTFGPPVTHAAGVDPLRLVVGDVDRDGRTDLVVSSVGNWNGAEGVDDGVTVLRNRGDGTFAATAYPDVTAPLQMALGDLDGDGAPELVLARYVVDAYATSWRSKVADVRVMQNDGGGRFAEPVSYAAGDVPIAVAITDLDGNGAADIAVADAGAYIGGQQLDGSVNLLFNAGGGTFAPALRHPVAGSPQVVTPGDLDGDGAIDLAVTSHTIRDGSALWGVGTVSVLRNTGGGAFAPAEGAIASAQSVSLADLDGDGKLDLGLGFGSSFGVALNQGGGRFAAPVRYAPGGGSMGVAVGDLDGDGRLDVAFPGASVSVLMNRGGGSLAAARIYGATLYPWSAAAEDFDGDGRSDLAVVDGGGVSVLSGTGLAAGDAFVSPATFPTDPQSRALAVGDIDGDGRPDLVLASPGNMGTAEDNGAVEVLLNAGGGAFTAARRYAAGVRPYAVALGDFDGDLRPDLAVANSTSGGVSVLRNVGGGAFGAAATYAAGRNPQAVAAADLDGDGRIDLAVANTGSSSVSVFGGRGDGTFAAGVNHATGPSPVALTVGDVDGDGRTDLVIPTGTLGYAGQVTVLANDGRGGFRAPAHYPVEGSPTAAAIGDFDGDGRPDLAVANGKVSVLVNRGGGTFAAAVGFDAGGSGSLAVLDANGDGRLDLAVSRQGRELSLLLNTSHRRGDGAP
jgi:hypothetical protein